MKRLASWWNQQHKNLEIRFLSNYPGEKIWRYLEIENYIMVNNRVLNIGIGTGRCTKDLKNAGMKVYGLDISEIPLERIRNIVEACWLITECDKIPSDFFDLAISHLVVQHTPTDGLTDQFREVIRCLRPTGIFAVQFASPVAGCESKETLFNLKLGEVLRTPEYMECLVNSVGGEVVHRCRNVYWEKFGFSWDGFHIRKATSSDNE